jgi:acetyl-CoA synthetase
MGKPVPGLDVQLVDDDGNIVTAGEIGEIAVRVTDPYPPGLFRGYHGDPQASARCFRGGWYYTGDTARRDEAGYIWFVGRSDDIITSAGYRISPFEVESALLEHPAVAESAVVGKPDPLRGEIVKAYVTLAAGFEASEDLVRELQAFVKRQTAPYKYPREITIRDQLPKTISGKIRRVELRTAAQAEAEAEAR